MSIPFSPSTILHLFAFRHTVNSCEFFNLTVADYNHRVNDYKPDFLKKWVKGDNDMGFDVSLNPEDTPEDEDKVPEVGCETQ